MVEWPMPGQSWRGCITGPDGNPLEVLIECPSEAAKGVMLICHPHPQFGGTLDNKVVYSLARSALSSGWVSVRFNFRGVGKSEGMFDDGAGELDDARSVLDWAVGQQSGKVMLSGFSFGSAIALRLAQVVSAQGLISIAPPLHYFAQGTLPEPDCPWLVIHGDKDDVVNCNDTLKILSSLQRKPETRVMKDAGHFFHGRLTELRQLVEPFLQHE